MIQVQAEGSVSSKDSCCSPINRILSAFAHERHIQSESDIVSISELIGEPADAVHVVRLVARHHANLV